MAFTHGKNTKVFFNEFNFTSYFDNATVNTNSDTAETTTFGKNSKTFIPGLKDATFSFEGFFDGSASAVDEKLYTVLNYDSVYMSVYPEGDTLGLYGYSANLIETAYSVTSTKDDACRISAAAQSDDSAAERVVSMHALGAEADANWTGTGNDNLAGSSNGGSAYLHVTAATGTIEVKLEHATASDFSDAADLVSFTAVTGATAQRVTFAGTVNRYVRGYATIGAGETITFQLGFCRAV